MYTVKETQEYQEWFCKLDLKSRAQVQARIARIICHAHFGDAKQIDKGLAELRWRNGRRIYFSVTFHECKKIIVLLLGGDKKSQARDIRKSKTMIHECI